MQRQRPRERERERNLATTARRWVAMLGVAPPLYHPQATPPCPSLPGCGCGALGPPRSTRPLAICCSRGTSTAVSHDSDCRSPGRSSSLVVARSLEGGAGAQEGWGAQASSRGGSPTSGITLLAPYLPKPLHSSACPPPGLGVGIWSQDPLLSSPHNWQPDHTSQIIPAFTLLT